MFMLNEDKFYEDLQELDRNDVLVHAALYHIRRGGDPQKALTELIKLLAGQKNEMTERMMDILNHQRFINMDVVNNYLGEKYGHENGRDHGEGGTSEADGGASLQGSREARRHECPKGPPAPTTGAHGEDEDWPQ